MTKKKKTTEELQEKKPKKRLETAMLEKSKAKKNETVDNPKKTVESEERTKPRKVSEKSKLPVKFVAEMPHGMPLLNIKQDKDTGKFGGWFDGKLEHVFNLKSWIKAEKKDVKGALIPHEKGVYPIVAQGVNGCPPAMKDIESALEKAFDVTVGPQIGMRLKMQPPWGMSEDGKFFYYNLTLRDDNPKHHQIDFRVPKKLEKKGEKADRATEEYVPMVCSMENLLKRLGTKKYDHWVEFKLKFWGCQHQTYTNRDGDEIDSLKMIISVLAIKVTRSIPSESVEFKNVPLTKIDWSEKKKFLEVKEVESFKKKSKEDSDVEEDSQDSFSASDTIKKIQVEELEDDDHTGFDYSDSD